jgi:striatin 1/3/4
LEPFVTLRGHIAPVLSIAFDHQGEYLYSGGIDSSLFTWKVPDEKAMYSPYGTYCRCFCIFKFGTASVPPRKDYYVLIDAVIIDKKAKVTQLIGHTDAIWDLKGHPLSSLLASCSADGTVKIWDSQSSSSPLLHTIRSENRVPTSIAFVPSDPQKLLVTYQSGEIQHLDIDVGKVISTVTTTSESTPFINRVVVHPTTNLFITAHEDRSTRIFDLNSGKCVHTMVTHMDAVAALDINPSGLSFVTGGHDCSVRLWDLGTRNCFQEMTGHRPRRSEGIWTARFASYGYLASGGADSAIKLYQGQT